MARQPKVWSAAKQERYRKRLLRDLIRDRSRATREQLRQLKDIEEAARLEKAACVADCRTVGNRKMDRARSDRKRKRAAWRRERDGLEEDLGRMRRVQKAKRWWANNAENDSMAAHSIHPDFQDFWQSSPAIRRRFPYAESPEWRAEKFGEWIETDPEEWRAYLLSQQVERDWAAEELAHYQAAAGAEEVPF